MSKQVGLIRLKGKLSGISFYKSGGADLARIAAGPSKQRIESDPAFVRVRENNREFGGSAITAKAFRLTFAEMVHTMGDRYMASRLTKLFREINLRGQGPRGERSISLSDNRFMLMNMEFNANKSFSSVFNAPYVVSHDTARTHVEVNVPSLVAQSFVAAPAGATHFRLVLSAGVLSDYVYDNGINAYVPFDPDANTVSGTDYSTMWGVNDTLSQAVNLAVDLTPPTALDNEVSVIAAFGIEFFQRVNSVDYLLAQGCGMKVADIF